MVAISTDKAEDVWELQQELSAGGGAPGLTLGLDPEGDVVRAFGVYDREGGIALPAVFMIDAAGVSRYKQVGESIVDRPEEDALLEALLRLRAVKH